MTKLSDLFAPISEDSPPRELLEQQTLGNSWPLLLWYSGKVAEMRAEIKRLEGLVQNRNPEPEPYGPPLIWTDDGKGPRAVPRWTGVEGQ